MNKKIAAVLTAVVLAVALTACGGASAGYTGEQNAAAKGMGGDVSVTVTFENGAVTKCDVDASGETPSIGQECAPKVAQEIVDANSPKVDAVAGATITSDAIMKAAQACFDAAGVKY